MISRESKIQEAIESLEYLASGYCTDPAVDYCDEIEIAIKALRSEIALPVLPSDETHPYCACPRCKHICSSCGLYCEFCGQRIRSEQTDTSEQQ